MNTNRDHSTPVSSGRLAGALTAGLACFFLILYVLYLSISGNKGGFDYQAFGALPVQERGRVKPIDTLARTSLLIINGRDSYRDEDGSQPASRWLLEVMTAPMKNSDLGTTESRQMPAFRIENERLRQVLKLPPRSGSLYSFDDLDPAMEPLIAERKRLASGASEDAAYHKAIDELFDQLSYYVKFARFCTPQRVFRIPNQQVQTLLHLDRRHRYRYSFEEIVPSIKFLIEEGERARAIDDKDPNKRPYDTQVAELYRHVQMHMGLAMQNLDTLQTVPPMAGRDDWSKFLSLLQEEKARNTQLGGPVEYLKEMLSAYAEEDPDTFNEQVEEYHAWLESEMPEEAHLAGMELFFNRSAPFTICIVGYVLVFMLVCLGWILHMPAIQRSAYWLTVVIFVVHTIAIVTRMYLQGRPPVTNLYSSAIFIGWCSVLLGMILEQIFRIGIGNAVGAITGFASCIVANHLATSGDTLEMMQAVLDTNFWLATHVTCITFGYAATFVAGFIGIAFILLGVFTPLLNREWLKTLSQIMYGIICFATFLSFTGTVLGGIWADQSWGRFWGWDPKENGALLIVLWNALILHARWCGWVKQRGMAVLAVAGNVITAWSWFGTNQLGVGLHSYGFNNTLQIYLTCFWVSMFILIGVGLIPTRHWKSFGRDLPAGKIVDSKKSRGKKRKQKKDETDGDRAEDAANGERVEESGAISDTSDTAIQTKEQATNPGLG